MTVLRHLVPTRTFAVIALPPALFAQLGPPPVPAENPITEPKRVLGKALFWDEQLSSDNSTACGSCHVPGAGGGDPRGSLDAVDPGLDGLFGTLDDKVGSPGVVHADVMDRFEPDPVFGLDLQVTRRNSPSFMTAAYFDELFWDGRAGSTFVDPETGSVSIPSGGALESQSVGPIVNSVEMAHEGRSWDQVRAKLEGARPLAIAWDLTPDLAAVIGPNTRYPDLFAAAYGDPGIDAERIAYALATYQRTIVPDATDWDLYMQGFTGALTPLQIQGMNDFNSPDNNCSVCHAPPLFSDGSYRNVGVRPIAEDIGRQAVTGQFADRGRFKVPSLRNVALRSRFFHTGTPNIHTLTMAVAFYAFGGGTFDENEDPLSASIDITPQELDRITAFLEALTDRRIGSGLPPFDRPRLNRERPVPNPALLGTANAGSGGQVPELIVTSPPNLGNGDYKVGLRNGLGGAPSFVALSLTPPGPLGLRGSLVTSPAITLDGAGPGGGYGTWSRALPDRPTLAGLSIYLQWFVLDPASSGGLARSQAAELTLF